MESIQKAYLIKQGKNINILNKCFGGLGGMGVKLDIQDGCNLK